MAEPPRPLGKAAFIEPMLLLQASELPDGPEWLHELKLDGYRVVAFKSEGRVHLRSRNNHDFNSRYPAICPALSTMPDETVIDGEIVAVDEAGRPSFQLLQNHNPSSKAHILYYLFDLLMIGGKDVTGETLASRRALFENEVLPRLSDPIRDSPELPGSVADLVQSVKAQGLEGLIAKRRDSRYEPGERTGAWRKMRVNRAQEFVVGGYTIGGATFDAVILGYYDGKDLMYAARTRNGYTPRLRDELMKRFPPPETQDCPFQESARIKERGLRREGLTAAKMNDCRWLTPVLPFGFALDYGDGNGVWNLQTPPLRRLRRKKGKKRRRVRPLQGGLVNPR